MVSYLERKVLRLAGNELRDSTRFVIKVILRAVLAQEVHTWAPIKFVIWFKASSWSCKMLQGLFVFVCHRTVQNGSSASCWTVQNGSSASCRKVQNGSAASVNCWNSRTIQNYLERFWNYLVFCCKTAERFRTVLWPRLSRLQNGLERFCDHSFEGHRTV